MRSINIFFMIIVVCHYLSVFPFAYTIKPTIKQELLGLHITLQFVGNTSGKTTIELPSKFAELTALWQNISKLIVKTPGVSLHNGKDHHVKSLHHKPNQRIEIEYEVYGTQPKEHPAFKFHNPLSTREYFHAPGSTFLVIPRLRNRTNEQCVFNFVDIPSGWQAASSFGVGEHHTIVDPHVKLNDSIFFIGNIRLHRFLVHNHPVYLAVHGTFHDASLIELSNRIIHGQRDFWHDYAFAHFLITVLEEPNSHKNRQKCGGTAFTNSFASFATSNTRIEQFKYLFSHEFFHTWNGVKISNAKPERALYWFSEGFTEYYAYELNRRNGIITHEQYQKAIKEIIAEYMNSRVRNVPNKKIIDQFWNDKEIKRLPYIRGFVFAIYVDNKIKQATQERHNLDTIMKDLLAHVTTTHEKMSNALLNTIIKKYIPTGILDDLERYIENGQTIIISK